MRVQRHCIEWPRGHMDAPSVPSFVKAFEAEHGPLPESANRIIDEFES